MHYVVKIFVIAFIFMLVSSRFTSFLPRFSEVTVADVQNEITAIEKFTQTELKEKHEIIANIKENIKKNKNKKLHKYEKPSDECYTDLVYVRLVLTFKAVWQKALIFVALAMVISHVTKCKIQWAYLVTDFIVLLLSVSYLPLTQLGCSLLTVLISGQLIGFVQTVGNKTSCNQPSEP